MCNCQQRRRNQLRNTALTGLGQSADLNYSCAGFSYCARDGESLVSTACHPAELSTGPALRHISAWETVKPSRILQMCILLPWNSFSRRCEGAPTDSPGIRLVPSLRRP